MAADCAVGACLGGCCCSRAATRVAGCGGCACWANASTTAATAGDCDLPPPPPPAAPPPCNASRGGGGGANASEPSLSGAIVFPDWAAVPAGDAPLYLVYAGAAGNPGTADIVVALPAACDAYATLGGWPQCDRGRSFVVNSQVYFYLDTAAALGMVPAADDCGN